MVAVLEVDECREEVHNAATRAAKCEVASE
jgi:hypothetical protein